MEPNLTDPREVEGVLNPAVARGPDGQLYLLPRLVGAGNYSRIGLARVLKNWHGDPVSVERLGVALEPEAAYERNPRTGGGVEDPRVTCFAACGLYVMTYTAYGPEGPRIAWALSRDVVRWRRLGLVRFAPYQGVDLHQLDNKDAVLFPEPVPAPDGRLALALIHRPGQGMPQPAGQGAASGRLLARPGMWLSYAPLDEFAACRLVVFGQHHLLASPQRPWERLKVGAGTPPVRLGDEWLVFYHGVSGQNSGKDTQHPHLHYRAGVLLLDGRDPRRVVYRSPHTETLLAKAEEVLGGAPAFPGSRAGGQALAGRRQDF
jgi:predicted GH43/DUF377 family glycosyl hydrolase